MNREKEILDIRPVLQLPTEETKPIELFQNNTLRPILKFQHAMSLALLKNHNFYKAKKVSECIEQEILIYIKDLVQSNRDIKNQIIGMMVGLFTIKEMEFYLANRKEVNKRLIQMQIKRYADSL